MHRAIADAEDKRGTGLWFPCPSKYDAIEFLSSLSDNLADAVEKRFRTNKIILSGLTRARNVLAIALVIIVGLAVVLYSVGELTAQARRTAHHGLTISLTFPAWAWAAFLAVVLAVLVLSAVVAVHNMAAPGALLSAASSLRERIRFAESLKLGVDLGLSASNRPVLSLRRSRERTLNERPTSVPSLIFGFRDLVTQISRRKRPLVICIDELDKIKDTTQVRALLRDVKGIFEVSGTHFLVSISEEAAAALQTGILQSGGRDELNSSFYSVISLPPLDSAQAHQLLQERGLGQTPRLASALCLLSGGNWRELIRMADLCAAYSRRYEAPLDEMIIIRLLAEETDALLQGITSSLPDIAPGLTDDNVKFRAWRALPQESFQSREGFIKLARSAITEYWQPTWAGGEWDGVSEPWRRLLIRLYLVARVLPAPDIPAGACLLDQPLAMADLQNVSVMATRDSGVARLMLLASFGGNFSQEYRMPRPTDRR